MSLYNLSDLSTEAVEFKPLDFWYPKWSTGADDCYDLNDYNRSTPGIKTNPPQPVSIK